jgi:hypothetical protein
VTPPPPVRASGTPSVATPVSQSHAQPQSPERVYETAGGQKLFAGAESELKPVILDENRQVFEIFDYRTTPNHSRALEVVMSWENSILDVEHYVDQKTVVIGSERGVDFGVPPVLSQNKVSFVTQSGEGYALQFDRTMKGVIQSQGQLFSIEQLMAEGKMIFQLSKNDFAKVHVGLVDFYLSYTAVPPHLKTTRDQLRDRFMLQVMLSALLFMFLLLMLFKTLQVPKQIEVEQVPERIAAILYQPEKYSNKKQPFPVDHSKPKEAVVTPQPDKTVKVDLSQTKPKEKEVPKTMSAADKNSQKGSKGSANQSDAKNAQNEAKEGAGARAKGKEGTRGQKNAKPGKEHQDKAYRPSPQGGDGRGGGHSQVEDQGNVDLLKMASSKVLDVLGNTNAKLGTGGEQLKGFGNFTTQGSGGKALSGTGKGGGGDAEGLGGLSDHGRGGGRVGTGMGAAGNGNGIIGGKSRVTLQRGGSEETIVMGSIDKDAILAAILAHKDEFTLCYEREINADTPNIKGTVGSSFSIGSTGRVVQAGIYESTIKNANVERCVITVLKRIEFPIPQGAGVVEVKFPFKFSSGK